MHTEQEQKQRKKDWRTAQCDDAPLDEKERKRDRSDKEESVDVFNCLVLLFSIFIFSKARRNQAFPKLSHCHRQAASEEYHTTETNEKRSEEKEDT